jgi:CRP/FNR family cyclic AMP-dependent transcriptional regulator
LGAPGPLTYHIASKDPLIHLPCAPILQYSPGQKIYDQRERTSGSYLVIAGKIAVSGITGDGHKVLMAIYAAEEFFGEAAFLGSAVVHEVAVTLETAQIMMWMISEIREVMVKRPKLGLALTQFFPQRRVSCVQRLQSLATDKVSHRLAWALMRFADRFGQPDQEDAERVDVPLTHEMLAQYVGTSREVVTYHLNSFRRRGCLRYSRSAYLLHREAMKECLAGSK